MTTTALLQSILTGIDPAVEVHRDFHRGSGEDYIVHEILTERDTAYADDMPQAQTDTVRVHYFTKGSSTSVKKAIRQRLREAGFTILYTEPLREPDTGYHHIVIEARRTAALEDDE